jgi:O-antigen ligase
MRLSKIITSLIIIAILAVVVIKAGIIGEDIINAYMSREMSSTSDASQLGGRSDIWADAVQQLVTHPLGWERVRYAHNLWLDIARVGGWFALLLFIIPTLRWVRSCFRLLRKPMTPFLLLILSMNAAMFLSSFVEPVIEGSILFFSLLMMVWGTTEYLSREIQ